MVSQFIEIGKYLALGYFVIGTPVLIIAFLFTRKAKSKAKAKSIEQKQEEVVQS